MGTFLIDNFITVQPGQAYRLLPFGNIVKGGKRRNVTRELVNQFKLPHFKPPIKLGSHADATPAGGHIVALEVRGDGKSCPNCIAHICQEHGLYALTELTPKGQQVFSDGDYRYHSPEIIWEDGSLEHPQTGELIDGPFIVGDALLHTPHLGEATAFYTYEEISRSDGEGQANGEKHMTTEMIQVPMTFWDKLTARFFEPPIAPPEPALKLTPPVETPQVDVAQLTALQSERDNYAAKVAEYEAKIQTMETERQHAARVEHFASEFKATALADSNDLHTLLAGIDETTAAALVIKFRALAAQAADVTRQVGGDSNDDVQGKGLHDMVVAYSIEHKTDYQTSFAAVTKERPELVAAWQKEAKK